MKVIRKCKNGSFLVQKDELDDARENSLIYELCNSIELDFEIEGDEYCVGNFFMVLPLRNHHTGLIYNTTQLHQEKYSEGKPVWLYGHEIREEYYGRGTGICTT